MKDLDNRINNLNGRVRDLHEQMVYFMFILSFKRQLPPSIHKIIKEIEKDLGGIYAKKK